MQAGAAGARTAIGAVEGLTGLTITHFAAVNLAGFAQISEAIGGVPVCLNKAVDDSFSGAKFSAGQQTVSGPQALAFVRQRHGLPGGDLDRAPAAASRCSFPAWPAPCSRRTRSPTPPSAPP